MLMHLFIVQGALFGYDNGVMVSALIILLQHKVDYGLSLADNLSPSLDVFLQACSTA